nr:hypothetical protein [Tanacetum cinerariifolium]
MSGRPYVNRKKDKSKMKNQTHVARPPKSMTCKNYDETGHKKWCEEPKVPGKQANLPNEQGNPPGQQANSPSQQDKSVTARGGIWMGGTSATSSNRGRGSVSGSNIGRGSANGSNIGRGSANGSNIGRGSASGSNKGRGRGRASGSNKVLAKKPVLSVKAISLYKRGNVVVGAENVAAGEDEKEEEAARLKKRMRHILLPLLLGYNCY